MSRDGLGMLRAQMTHDRGHIVTREWKVMTESHHDGPVVTC